jgi:hypothetical protein
MHLEESELKAQEVEKQSKQVTGKHYATVTTITKSFLFPNPDIAYKR